jgi:hypothetical protein
MNELTRDLLDAAYQNLPARKRSLAHLECEVGSQWVIWRNHQVEAWAMAVLPEVQRRQASDYYDDPELMDACLDWLYRHGLYDWETPVGDGEDDDDLYEFIAHWLAVMAWIAFEPLWPHLDYTRAELEEFFNFKKADVPPLRKGEAGIQLSLF